MTTAAPWRSHAERGSTTKGAPEPRPRSSSSSHGVRFSSSRRAALLARLDELNRTPWLEEELRGLGSGAPFVVDPRSAWLRQGAAVVIESLQALQAQQLAAWREERAMARNLPRGWI